MTRRFTLALALALSGVFTLLLAQGTGQDHWVATWASAQALIRMPAPPPRGGQTTISPQQSIALNGFNNQTVRMIVRSSIGGKRLRVRLTNSFGAAPVVVGAAHIAVRGKESEIVPATDRALSFNGKPGCTIGPGVVLLSDPVELNVPKVSDLAVSLYFPGETGPPTALNGGLHTAYISKEGDLTAQAAIPDALTTLSYYFLAGVDVLAPPQSSLIVAFGDSITEGARSTPNTDHSWPALLAARLAANKATTNIGIVNLGIGGNRILRDQTGASALARFDRDVLSQPGVKWMMWLEGINDIGRGSTNPADAVTAEELIGGYKQLIERAHTHGIKVIGCTLTPYEGAGYSSENGEVLRQALNTWIRTSGAYDAVVDFDAATRDPNSPRRFRPDLDPGDHLHPNDTGYQAMADAVNLSIFTAKPR